MTTIIYRDGTIVGDGKVQQNYLAGHTTQKIFKLDDGRLVGFAGQMNVCQAFCRHLIDPTRFGRPPLHTVEALVVHPDDPELIYEFTGDNMPCTFRSSYAAIGSGMRVAMSLLSTTNISAMDAMLAVGKLDVNTGPPYIWESFKRKRQHDFGWLLKLPFSPETLKIDRHAVGTDDDDDDDLDVTRPSTPWA